ncbi:MAG: protein TolR [Gammaproteobacteria bacterium]|nr:protein TolR [Gammaproteobacteria bacterium]
MRSRFNKSKTPLAEINVVPYIDVMLVLLVIFMITAPLLSQGIHVSLPQARAKALANSRKLPVIVSVDRLGHYYLNVNKKPSLAINGQQLLTQMAARVKLATSQHRPLTVYVKGDRNVDYGKVVHAMVLIQAAGVKQVGLITQPKQL